jgi:RND family efflux transporter MFP subunit
MKHRKEIERKVLERVAVVRRGGLSPGFLKIVVPLMVLVMAAGVAAYLVATRPKTPAKPPSERVWTVAVVPAKAADVQPERRFFGRVIAARETELRAEVAGTVVEIGPNFIEGGVVKEGDMLLRIDPFDYEAAIKETESDLNAARGMLVRDREQVELLRRDVARRVKLKGRGAGSAKALDDAHLRLSEAQQRAVDRQNRIERLEVGLSRAQRALADTRIVAPFDGFLSGVATAAGQYVRVGDKLAKAINAKRLEVRFLVSNAQFNAFLANGRHKDQPAKVLWSGQRYDAVLDRVESEVKAASGGVEVFARLEGTDAATNLRPGAFVEVYVPGPQFKSVVRIPERALHGGDTVYSVADSRLDPRKVMVLGRDGDDVFIRGEFAEGDAIVTTRIPEIGPGMKVRVP